MPGLKGQPLKDLKKKRVEDKARESKTEGRQGGVPKNKGQRRKQISEADPSSLSPGKAGPCDLGQGQRPVADPGQMCMVCGSVSQGLVSPWPEAGDSLTIRNLSLQLPGHPLRQGPVRARLPALGRS